MSKIKSVLIERRVPWFIQSRLETARNRYHYYRNRFLHSRKGSHSSQDRQKKTVTFKCGYHGKSGGVVAIANIANLLASQFDVEFVSYPDSLFNSLLDKGVEIVDAPNMGADLFICDASCEHEVFEALNASNKKCIVSCHGLLDSLHGLNPEYVRKSLDFADKVHFVSAVQQESFQLQGNHYEIIPNTTNSIRKTQRTNNVGVVGNLREERKNAKEAVEIAVSSKADLIHLWGADPSAYDHPKVKAHSWESNKEKIYNSFDVLVFMSKQENCPMAIIESLSAGIPCVLSSIPAFEQFKACPGVELIDSSNRARAPQILNDLLDKKDELREPIIRFWREQYSEQVIRQRWVQMIAAV